MSKLRFVLLITLVMACAGLTLWVAFAAIEAGRLDQNLLFSLAPLVMVASIALRALRGKQD